MIALPPFELGAFHVSATAALPAVAFTRVGEPGTVPRVGRLEPRALDGDVPESVGDAAPAFAQAATGANIRITKAAAVTVLPVTNLAVRP